MERVNDLLSGKILPGCLLLFALGMLIYLRGKPFLPLRAGAAVRKGEAGSSRRAVLMALAGTLGVGNITGVADAVMRGGPGVLFWMWASAFAAMIVKYAEVLLLMKTVRKKNAPPPAGPMLYMNKAAGKLFALFGIAAAFSIGSCLQAKAVSQSFAFFPQVSPALPCFLLALPVLFLILLRKSDLFALTEIIVPVMSLLYLLLCLTVIIKNAAELPRVFQEILRGAFDFRGAAHGLAFSGMTALRFGVIRGLLSNEAGCGTAPIAHAYSGAPPERQARLGVVEVAVDTLLLCTATGFIVLLCPSNAGFPLETVENALSGVFGGISAYLLPPALFAFAFATLLCWSLYLDCFARSLIKRERAAILLKFVFCALCAISFLIPEKPVWQIADLSAAAMTFLNLCFLFLRRRQLRDDP